MCKHSRAYYDENTKRHRCTECGEVVQEGPIVRANMMQRFRQRMLNPEQVDIGDFDIEGYL